MGNGSCADATVMRTAHTHKQATQRLAAIVERREGGEKGTEGGRREKKKKRKKKKVFLGNAAGKA